MNYLLFVLSLILIYVILAISFNILLGYTGLLSLTHGAFFGIGAYTVALLTIGKVNFFIALPVAFIFTALIAALLFLPTQRLKGDYFILATFGLQIIIVDLIHNMAPITGGPYGLYGIPAPSILGITFSSNLSVLLLAAAITLVLFLTYVVLVDSPFGRVLKAVRDDEVACQVTGRNTVRFKAEAFAIAAGFAGVAGGLYSPLLSALEPTSFGIHQSMLVLAMVIIGGLATKIGPIIGAAILIVFPEVLRFVGLPATVSGPLQQILYGLLIILVIMFRPTGIVGKIRLR